MTGKIGDRDALTYGSNRYAVVEAQVGQPPVWHIFLYDARRHVARALVPRTPGGSVGFANPAATIVRDPAGRRALVVTLFLPHEGAAPGETGELIYYRRFGGRLSSGTGQRHRRQSGAVSCGR